MSIREQIKNEILSKAQRAGEQITIIKNTPGISCEKVTECINNYVCMKFFLEPSECQDMTLNEMAEMSMDRAIDMKLPMAKESELATTCGTAGSAPMKIALLLNAIRKDLGIQIDPHRLGMVVDIKELGRLVYDCL